MKLKQKLRTAHRPLVVATAHTAGGVAQAARLRRGVVDLVELRLDCLTARVSLLSECVSRIRIPILLTARHPAEGGAPGLSAGERRDSINHFIGHAAAVDIELRSVRTFAAILGEARERGICAVVSFHDFSRTPSLDRLRRIVADSRSAGADIVKIATRLRGPRDLATLLQVQASAGKAALATMGMGPLGRVSRLALACAGSRLNYGYLDKPQVAGQWPAQRLKTLIAEVRA